MLFYLLCQVTYSFLFPLSLVHENMESSTLSEKADKPATEGAAEHQVPPDSDGEGEMLESLGYKVSRRHELVLSRALGRHGVF